MEVGSSYRGILIAIFSFVFFNTHAQEEDFKEVVKSQSEFLNGGKITFMGKDTMAFFGYSRYEDLGPFWFSTDQGTTWRCKGYEVVEMSGGIGESKLALDLKTVVMSHPVNGLVISTDSGASYTAVAPPSKGDLVRILKFGPNIMLKYDWDGSFISTDTCKTFEKMTVQLNGELVYEKGPHIIMSTLQGKPYMESKDYGVTWLKRDYFQGVGSVYRHLTDSVIYVVNSFQNTIKWSNDKLKTISETVPVVLDSFPNIREVAFFNRYIGYLLTTDSRLYKTYDGGKTWNKKYTFSEQLTNIAIINEQTVAFHNAFYISENPMLFVTNNGAERLSQQELSHNLGLHIYPNPGQHLVTISSEKFQNGHLSILNMDGKTVYQSPYLENATIATQNWPQGVYLIKLSNDEFLQHGLLQVLK